MTENINYVNRTGANIDEFFSIFAKAYTDGVLDADYDDIFEIEILTGYNKDGSDRMLIDWA